MVVNDTTGSDWAVALVWWWCEGTVGVRCEGGGARTGLKGGDRADGDDGCGGQFGGELTHRILLGLHSLTNPRSVAEGPPLFREPRNAEPVMTAMAHPR